MYNLRVIFLKSMWISGLSQKSLGSEERGLIVDNHEVVYIFFFGGWY